jgi:hypothetical protein
MEATEMQNTMELNISKEKANEFEDIPVQTIQNEIEKKGKKLNKVSYW